VGPYSPPSPPALQWNYPLHQLPLALSFLLFTDHGRCELGHHFPLSWKLQHVVDEIARPEMTYNAHSVVSGSLKRLAANEHVKRVIIFLAVRVGWFEMGTPALRGTTDPV